MDCKKAFTRALIAAVLADEPSLIEPLVTAGADVNIRSPLVGRDKGSTPLILAIRYRRFNCMEVLLRIGADVNKINFLGVSPLMMAINTFKDDCDCVRLLTSSGASVNEVDRWGETALLFAVRNGYASTVELLLESGAKVNTIDNHGQTPLFVAAKNGNLTTTKLLLESGADVNVSQKDGATAITVASLRGDADIVKILAESGANVNVRDISTHTPLMLSYVHNEPLTVKTLIQSGADVNSIDNVCGWTALMLIICGGHRRCIESLGEFVQSLGVAFPYTAIGNHQNLVAFMNSKAPEVFSKPCFHYKHDIKMVREFNPVDKINCARLLITSGANVNYKCKSGWTALMVAGLEGEVDTVKLLLESGADVNAVSQ